MVYTLVIDLPPGLRADLKTVSLSVDGKNAPIRTESKALRTEKYNCM